MVEDSVKYNSNSPRVKVMYNFLERADIAEAAVYFVVISGVVSVSVAFKQRVEQNNANSEGL